MSDGTVVLKLNGGHEARIDAEDRALLDGWSVVFDKHNGYVRCVRWDPVTKRTRSKSLHALILDAPKGMVRDHINGDKLDNRRANLRVVTAKVNSSNRVHLSKSNTSGVHGVSWSRDRQRWLAQLTDNGERRVLGYYESVQEAADARRQAEREVFGDVCPASKGAVVEVETASLAQRKPRPLREPKPRRARLIQTNIYVPAVLKDAVLQRVLSLNVEAQDPGAWTLSRWFVDLAARELGIVFDEEGS